MDCTMNTSRGVENIPTLFSLLFLLTAPHAFGQARLEIHHINVNNGDATVIAVADDQNKFVKKILIDGGQSDFDKKVRPYCRRYFKNVHFDYIVLTHYHDDHYKGLLGLGTGALKGDSLIDPGGYSLSNLVKKPVLAKIQPKKRDWKIAVNGDYKKAIANAAKKYGLARVQSMNPDSGNEVSAIGHEIEISYIHTAAVSLRCVGFWGWGLSKIGAENVWEKHKKTDDPNNMSIAFILQCGAFRYFLGGDMGGKKTKTRIDMETPLEEGLRNFYRNDAQPFTGEPVRYSGHICGLKANDHGSATSNSELFLDSIRPAICVTSAGNNANWRFPSNDFLKRLIKLKPVTESLGTGNNCAQGFYFTNLKDFSSRQNSKTTAVKLLAQRPLTGFKFGAIGYVISVAIDSTIANESKFSVYKINSNYKLDSCQKFTCHKN